MKWCVHFPDEEILIKRPYLKQACAGNKNAATLLSFLLYHASINRGYRGHGEMSQDEQQEIRVTLYFTQREIVARIDAEMCDRTLRETAIPLLVALDDTEKTTAYTVNVTKIQAGIDHAMLRFSPKISTKQRSTRDGNPSSVPVCISPIQ